MDYNYFESVNMLVGRPKGENGYYALVRFESNRGGTLIEIKGPHRLDHIDYYVRETSPGVYMLSNDGERIEVVGRSDDDIREAIMKASGVSRGVDSKYSYFWIILTENAKSAFHAHCKVWHRYHYMKGIENHPIPSNGESESSCPVSECEWNHANGLTNEVF